MNVTLSMSRIALLGATMPGFGVLAAALRRATHPADAIFEGMKRKPDWNPWERRLIAALAALGCRHKLVDFEGDPYLLRIYLLRWRRDLLPGVYLHCFLRGDADRELHSHPWRRALSVIFAGGYYEERLGATVDPETNVRRVSSRRRRPVPLAGCINVLGEDDFHRVDLVGERCWTLFVAGRRVQHWGFYDARTGEFRHAEDDRTEGALS